MIINKIILEKEVYKIECQLNKYGLTCYSSNKSIEIDVYLNKSRFKDSVKD